MPCERRAPRGVRSPRTGPVRAQEAGVHLPRPTPIVCFSQVVIVTCQTRNSISGKNRNFNPAHFLQQPLIDHPALLGGALYPALSRADASGSPFNPGGANSKRTAVA